MNYARVTKSAALLTYPGSPILTILSLVTYHDDIPYYCRRTHSKHNYVIANCDYSINHGASMDHRSTPE